MSIGLSYCKFLAKIASDFDKPRGFSVLGRAEAKSFLADKPVRLIWGIGKVAETRLARDGFRTIGDLQRRSEVEMMKLLGAEGRRLWRLANGIDDRSVNPERETKGISAETTFEADFVRCGNAASDPVPTLRKGGEAPESSGLGWPQRDAEAEIARIQAAHAIAIRPARNAARIASV